MLQMVSLGVYEVQSRLSSKKKYFRFEPKQTETQSVSVDFWFVSRNKKKHNFFRFVSVFRTRFETTEKKTSFSKQTKKQQKTKEKHILKCRVGEPDP
jgi:hypothetical protein